MSNGLRKESNFWHLLWGQTPFSAAVITLDTSGLNWAIKRPWAFNIADVRVEGRDSDPGGLMANSLVAPFPPTHSLNLGLTGVFEEGNYQTVLDTRTRIHKES